MADGLKTYDELIDAARTQFSPDARHFREPRTMEATLVSDLAVLLGYERDMSRKREEQFSDTTSFLGNKGVKSFARSIAFFGYFDGADQLRTVPWTNAAVKHYGLWQDVNDQARDVRSPDYAQLIGGYTAQFENGVTVAYHTGTANIVNDEVRMQALRSVTAFLPNVEQILVGADTHVYLGPN